MNIDTLVGEGTAAKGRFKESLGTATNDPDLERHGLLDQLSGNARSALGGIRDFARSQPIVAAAVAGIIGFAFLRGRRAKRKA